MGAILHAIVYDVLASAPILVGLIAFVGLILQKKPADKVITGTLKTIVGFLVFNIGSAATSAALTNFQTLFAEGFHLKGIMPLAEAVTALAQNQFGSVVALVMVVGFLCNLIVARLTPLKYIFLTGQHNLYFAAMFTIMFKAFGLSDAVTVALGGILLGICAGLFPAIAQPGMRKVTGDDELAMGHYVTVGYAISSWIGSKVGDPKDSTETMKLPGWFVIFKDYVVGVSITMIVFYYVTCIAAGKPAVEELSGGTSWLVYPLFQGLYFAASLYAIITGVRLFLGEIITAFVGISEKLIPNAKPALDCPVVFGFAPTATILGFLSAYAAGLITMFIMAALGTTVVIPVATAYFFIGATAGVFGNATGGWKGCIAGAFVVGILIAVGPALIYPVMESLGLLGTSFPETDFNIVGLILYGIGHLFGAI